MYADPWLESVTRIIVEPSTSEARQTIMAAVATVSGIILLVSAAIARKVNRTIANHERGERLTPPVPSIRHLVGAT